jgi:hypothetical protein
MFNKNEEKIKEALEIAWTYATIDGCHHKMWVINQMVKALCGSEEEYRKWIEAYETPAEDGSRYEWDVGIAP